MLALPSTPPSTPIYSAVLDSARSSLAVLEVSKGKLLTLSVERRKLRLPSGTVNGLATDGRRLVTIRGAGSNRKVWAQRVDHAGLSASTHVAASSQPSNVVGTSEGRFLVVDESGAIAWVLPYCPSKKVSGGGGRRVLLRLTRDRAHYTLVAQNWLLMGESAWTSVAVGRLSGASSGLTAKGAEENGPAEREVLYLPSRKEVWTFDGGPNATLYRVVGRGLSKTSSLIPLPTNGRQAVEVRPGVIAIWDAYGGLSLAQVEHERIRSLGSVARLPGEAGNAVELRVARDGAALVVAAPASGSLWTVPILGSRDLGKPKRLFNAGHPCTMALSY